MVGIGFNREAAMAYLNTLDVVNGRRTVTKTLLELVYAHLSATGVLNNTTDRGAVFLRRKKFLLGRIKLLIYEMQQTLDRDPDQQPHVHHEEQEPDEVYEQQPADDQGEQPQEDHEQQQPDVGYVRQSEEDVDEQHPEEGSDQRPQEDHGEPQPGAGNDGDHSAEHEDAHPDGTTYQPPSTSTPLNHLLNVPQVCVTQTSGKPVDVAWLLKFRRAMGLHDFTDGGDLVTIPPVNTGFSPSPILAPSSPPSAHHNAENPRGYDNDRVQQTHVDRDGVTEAQLTIGESPDHEPQGRLRRTKRKLFGSTSHCSQSEWIHVNSDERLSSSPSLIPADDDDYFPPEKTVKLSGSLNTNIRTDRRPPRDVAPTRHGSTRDSDDESDSNNDNVSTYSVHDAAGGHIDNKGKSRDSSAKWSSFTKSQQKYIGSITNTGVTLLLDKANRRKLIRTFLMKEGHFCSLKWRNANLTDKGRCVSDYGQCMYPDCRTYRFDTRVMADSQFTTTCGWFNGPVLTNHLGKVRYVQLRGAARDAVKQVLVNTKPSNYNTPQLLYNTNSEALKARNMQNLLSPAAARKVRSEALAIGDYHSDPHFDLILRAEHGPESEFIQFPNGKTLVYLFKAEHLRVAFGHHTKHTLHFDATGSVVSRTKYDSSQILLYRGIVSVQSTRFAVVQMLTSRQDAVTISHMFEAFKHFLNDPTHRLPHSPFTDIVVDGSFAVMNAVCRGWLDKPLSLYLHECFNIASTCGLPLKVRLRMCAVHFINAVSRKLREFCGQKNKPNFVRHYYCVIVGLMIDCRNWEELKLIFKHMMTICCSKFITPETTHASAALQMFSTEKLPDDTCDDHQREDDDAASELEGIDIYEAGERVKRDSNFYIACNDIFQEVVRKVEPKEGTRNPYQLKRFAEYMLHTNMPLAPLWSAIVVPRASPCRIDNNIVESDFRSLKHDLLDGKRFLKLGRFIRHVFEKEEAKVIEHRDIVCMHGDGNVTSKQTHTSVDTRPRRSTVSKETKKQPTRKNDAGSDELPSRRTTHNNDTPAPLPASFGDSPDMSAEEQSPPAPKARKVTKQSRTRSRGIKRKSTDYHTSLDDVQQKESWRDKKRRRSKKAAYCSKPVVDYTLQKAVDRLQPPVDTEQREKSPVSSYDPLDEERLETLVSSEPVVSATHDQRRRVAMREHALDELRFSVMQRVQVEQADCKLFTAIDDAEHGFNALNINATDFSQLVCDHQLLAWNLKKTYRTKGTGKGTGKWTTVNRQWLEDAVIDYFGTTWFDGNTTITYHRPSTLAQSLPTARSRLDTNSLTVFPCHLSTNHWALVVLMNSSRTVCVMEPLHSSHYFQVAVKTVKRLLKEADESDSPHPKFGKKWNYKLMEVYRQTDTEACGIAVIHFLDVIRQLVEKDGGGISAAFLKGHYTTLDVEEYRMTLQRLIISRAFCGTLQQEICALCFRESRHFNQSDQWMQCDYCSLWYHTDCVSDSRLPLNISSDDFTCSLCSNYILHHPHSPHPPSRVPVTTADPSCSLDNKTVPCQPYDCIVPSAHTDAPCFSRSQEVVTHESLIAARLNDTYVPTHRWKNELPAGDVSRGIQLLIERFDADKKCLLISSDVFDEVCNGNYIPLIDHITKCNDLETIDTILVAMEHSFCLWVLAAVYIPFKRIALVGPMYKKQYTDRKTPCLLTLMYLYSLITGKDMDHGRWRISTYQSAYVCRGRGNDGRQMIYNSSLFIGAESAVSQFLKVEGHVVPSSTCTEIVHQLLSTSITNTGGGQCAALVNQNQVYDWCRQAAAFTPTLKVLDTPWTHGLFKSIPPPTTCFAGQACLGDKLLDAAVVDHVYCAADGEMFHVDCIKNLEKQPPEEHWVCPVCRWVANTYRHEQSLCLAKMFAKIEYGWSPERGVHRKRPRTFAVEDDTRPWFLVGNHRGAIDYEENTEGRCERIPEQLAIEWRPERPAIAGKREPDTND